MKPKTKSYRPYPLIYTVKWIGENKVRVSFSTGRIMEIALPIFSARRVQIVIQGLGLDPGDGMEISATRLYGMRGRVVRREREKRA